MSILQSPQGDARANGSGLPGERWLLIGGLLLAFALRLYQLGGESLWYDETVSVYLARKPLPAMLAHTAGDIHPPGYYLLLHLWQLLTAPALQHGLEFLFAWPSLCFGLVTLILIYAVSRQLLGRTVALVALWLGAVNPFQLWYSQEVRMYTLGAALGLLSVWAALHFLSGRHARRWLLVYVLAAASGLYTLYYFAFLLIAVNFVVLLLLWSEPEHRVRRRAGTLEWIAAQALVALLFAPWLPTFWRQATEPPVPPWRTPWTSIASFGASLAETFAALLVGESPPAARDWPWALLAFALLAAFVVWAVVARQRRAAMVVLGIVLLPVALLYLLTLWVTPIYHVRYVFIYAPLFLTAVAAVVVVTFRASWWAGIVTALLLLGLAGSGLQQLWANPEYRADDHRNAVAALAYSWRPGDLILVNAGWVYTTLAVYWPVEHEGVESVVPPDLSQIHRFGDYAKELAAGTAPGTATPIAVTLGSVDGNPSLGWGSATSDFFPVSRAGTAAALTTLVAHYNRLWHYRMYDTVSDPDATVRTWLDGHASLLWELPIPGRDFGLLQLYDPPGSPFSEEAVQVDDAPFGAALRLLDHSQPQSAVAGAPLYVDLRLQSEPGIAQLDGPLATSLRLYDSAGYVAAQADTPLLPASTAWAPGTVRRQPLALPVGAATKPGQYSLELVIYRQASGEPLALPETPRTRWGQSWQLGEVTITHAARPPEIDSVQATFDYIDLVDASLDRDAARGGETVTAILYWRPRPNPYSDTYRAMLSLRDSQGSTAQQWIHTAGGDDYPSGAWPAGFPVRDLHPLVLDPELPPGNYTITLALERAADGLLIPAQQGSTRVRELPLGVITVGE
ncbi:MAG: glycosyltransferase family 39 protein [Caldilineaceae bacterium]|nr:glycosyltransferase family 39 protein [Caldilineaceae bacterium]